MKTSTLIAVALFTAFACQSQQPAPPLPPSGLPPRALPALPVPAAPPVVAPAREPVNYLIRVEWKEPKADPKSLEVLTTEGNFELDTIQKTTVKINDADIPVTLKFNGTLKELSSEKGRLQLFLGRTVPYVTGASGSGPNARASYSQMNVGLQSTFVVTFGKPVVIQNDENGEITVLVKRIPD